VLGFNFVLDMALGLSMLSKLKCQKQGVVGTRRFWIHALASTRLMPKLFRMMPSDTMVDEQAIFLVALLHNIGFPLFGHQFPDEFHHLNTLIDANPNLAIFNLETFAFGVNHCQIGAWLMNAWLMPRLLTDIVYHHHNPCYRGENFKLNLLTFLNDHLLGLIGIGDAMHQECPESVFELLGLDRSQCQILLETMKDEIDAIVAIAESLT
jgi:HD-like signal output (HDOD) protein